MSSNLVENIFSPAGALITASCLTIVCAMKGNRRAAKIGTDVVFYTGIVTVITARVFRKKE